MPKSAETPAHRILCDYLRKVREDAEVGQRELGRRLGKHHTFVGLCESGERQLNVIELRDWCLALGVSWVEFTREVDTAISKLNVPKPD